MPQASTPNRPAATTANPPAATGTAEPVAPEPAIPDPGTGDDYPSRKIAQAQSLEAQRMDLQDRIAANRRQLRDMEETGDLTSQQVEWLNAFYPEKERGARRSKDDIVLTRRVKEAARKAAKAA